MHPQNLIREIFFSLLFKIRSRGFGILNNRKVSFFNMS